MHSQEPFFGRSRETKELGELLLAPGCPVVTVTGIGGIGKTTLAKRVLEEYRHSFKDGGRLVSLSGLEHSRQLAPAVLSSLGREAYAPEAEKRLLDALSRMELLLVLDNLEHIVSSAPVISALASRLTSTKILITSRTSLGFPLEHEYRLDGMELSPNGDSVSPSMQLFLSVCGKDLSEADRVTADQICRNLAGVPLGIKLAASMCSVSSLDGVHTAVSVKSGLPDIRSRTGERRHRSLRAVFDYSWSHLTAEERKVFAALSVFRDRFTAEAARGVTGGETALLESLLRKSLLELYSPGVFGLHPLVHGFSCHRFTELFGHGSVYRKNHARYYADLLVEMGKALDSTRSEEAMALLDGCFADVSAALAYAMEAGFSDVLKASIEPLRSFLMRKGNLEEGRITFRAMSDCFAGTDQESHSRAMLHLGCFHLEGTDYPAATRCFSTAAESDSLSIRSSALLQWGLAEMRQGRLKQAEAHMVRALEVARQAGHRPHQAKALEGIGDLYNHMYDLEKASYFLLQAIEINRSEGHQSQLFSNLVTLSNLMYNNRKGTEALEYALEARELAQALGGELYLGLGEISVASALELLGRYPEALEYAEKSVEYFSGIDSRWGLQTSCTTLGSVQLRLGLKEESLQTARKLEELALEIGPTINTMESLMAVGDIHLAAGSTEAAMATYRRAHAMALSLEYPHYVNLLEEKINKIT